MRVVVAGGTGRTGAEVVARLRAAGHEAVAAARSTGVDVVTGDGLARALAGARVVVDATGTTAGQPEEPLRLFEGGARNLARAARDAGVAHHLVLSVVGADALPDSPYLRAKLAQEDVVRGAGTPWTVLRATQFHEFVGTVVEGAYDGRVVRVSAARMQPVAVDEVADLLAGLAVGAPAGLVELGGPQALPVGDLAARWLAAHGDPREVVVDPAARYAGAVLQDASLLPGPGARTGTTTFAQWLRTPVGQR
ncbi:SDR family oxidoreductase [Vallicoccus soli]|uniref:NmrA family transcriptional regulator n=1 Tax=Vallicoccus soli TaxID=2339232 RepID=A0A3A3Z000_9ACTN|nr:NAD(P)H-binding protein [Vallicoccus soli]RJK97559.1 NmrA family transcriptional regulator [Vallicoccus soli]